MRSLILFTMILCSYATQAQDVPHWATPVNVRIFVLANTFDAKENQRVSEAVESWHPFLPDDLTTMLAGPSSTLQTCKGCVTIIRQETPGKERGETTAYHHDGVTDYVIVRIDPRARGNEFLCVIEHELGHALGLPHYPKSVMQERSSNRHPAEIDAEKLRAIYTLARYAFRRIVTIKNQLVRSSLFTFNDAGELIETEVSQTGRVKGDDYWKRFPVFPIGRSPSAPAGFFVVWTNEQGIADTQELPWFQESVVSGMFFPVKAIDRTGNVSVRFFDYRLFRTTVTVKEIEGSK